ncbi:MAG: hypothetical protein RQ847_08535 [Wenzhouxiangellaceae bacterium]|nr:hypothetical protein [Wenzhouxiangellaceae bacterium]
MSAEASGVTQHQAELLARWFNTAVTNTAAYGGEHMVTTRSRRSLLEALRESLGSVDSVTLMLDRDTLFVEEFAADAKFNSARLIKRFRDAGLNSLTFGPGVDERQLAALLDLLALEDGIADAGSLGRALSARGVDGVRINHVVMRRFSIDEEVVSREGLEQLTGLAEQALTGRSPTEMSGISLEAGEHLGERIDHVLTLGDLLEHPDRTARRVLEYSETDARARASVAARIRRLATEFPEAGENWSERKVSLHEVVDAIARLRKGLEKGLAGQAEMARLMAESGGVLDEVSRLSCQAIVTIVREEFRSGDSSAPRLADLVRRIVPDPRELKRLMPELKRGLLAEGMPLGDFIELVNELAAELRGEGLVQALAGGAEGLGIPVEDILREIRHRPAEAARVLVLAAELRQAGHPDESVFSEALSDYVERIVADGAGDAVEAMNLQQAIARVRTEIGARLRTRGLSERVSEQIESGLDQRLEGLEREIRARRVETLLANAGELENAELRDSLVGLLRHKSELPWLFEVLQQKLSDRGFDRRRIRRLHAEVEARFRTVARVSFLPGEPLDSTATAFFLEREIAACIRYRTCFSAIMLMIARVREAGTSWRPVAPAEVERLVPQVLEMIPAHLRDLDLLGTLGNRHGNIPLVLMPMTVEHGSSVVLARILETLRETGFELERSAVRIDATGVAAAFDPEKTASARAFIQWMRGQLANRLVARLRAGSE